MTKRTISSAINGSYKENSNKSDWPVDSYDPDTLIMRGRKYNRLENDIIDLVGADNLPEIRCGEDFSFEEKAAVRIWGLFLRNDQRRIKKILKPLITNQFRSVSKKKKTLIEQYLPFSFDPCSQKNEESFFSLIEFNEYYHNPDDQCSELDIKPSMFSDFRLDRAFSVVPLPLSPLNESTFTEKYSDITLYYNSLDSFIQKGFPSILLSKNRFPIFEDSFQKTKLLYFLRGKSPEESMFVLKHFTYCDNQLAKVYLPAIFLRDKEGDLYVAFTCLPKAKKRKLFSGGHLPLYNSFGINRIEDSEKVVICRSLEDADILQQNNKSNKKVSFVSFVCDPGCFYQVDFSPLKNKTVEFLITNQSERTLEEERTWAIELYHFLNNKKAEIKEFSFREREVIYPLNSKAITPQDYYLLYHNNSPRILSNSIYTESEFQTLLGKGTLDAENTKEEDKSATVESKSPHAGRPKHLNLTAEKTLLRPFIRRGCTTVLVGDPQIGKSRFAFALAAQVAGSNAEFLKDRLWTRCLTSDGEKTGFKVVYWVFDDVDQDDIFLQRKYFAKGLNSVQEKNLIIEPARSIRKRDCENLKEELKKYSSMGTPNHPVDFLIIDTLLSFARSPAKIFSAFEELVRLKDELPNLAILVLHHNSKEGNPYGGILTTNMPRVIIEMKRDITSVLDDLEVPITINVIKHSNEHAGIDIIPFEIKLDAGHFVVTNNSDLPFEKVQKLVIHEYKHNPLESFSNTDIGRLLGVGRSPIETIWKQEGVEEEAQALLDHLKEEFREKALNELYSKKKNRKRGGRRRIDDEGEDIEDDSLLDY